jgi:acetyl esterase/lipase
LAIGLTVTFAELPLVRADQGSRTPRTGSNNNPTVREIQNISYSENPKRDSIRHKLDLFLPADKRDFPVVVFVHGGSWMRGDKSFAGWGGDIGRFFARHGIGAVMPNYGLSPRVRHPEHVKDVARAFAWTLRNIPKYGGSADQLFLCGHSAGGHLVSLLATNDAYLKAEGVSPSAVKGVISVSGVYRVFALALRLTMTGNDISLSFGPVSDLPSAPKPKRPSPSIVGLDFQLDLFGKVFGVNPQIRQEASPLSHVKAGLPPFLIVNPATDLPGLGELAGEFVAALKKAKCDVEVLTVKDRNHDSVMFQATRAADPVAHAIEKFVLERIKKVVQTASAMK